MTSQFQTNNSTKAAAMTSVHSATAAVSRQINDSNEWTDHELNIETVVSLTDDSPKILNLISTFGSNSRTSKKMKLFDLDRYWLPKKFNKNDFEFRSNQICKHFSVPALNAGFALRIRGWKKERNHLQFKCIRGSYYAPSRKPKKTESEIAADAKRKAEVAAQLAKSKPKSKKKIKACCTQESYQNNIQTNRW